MLSDPESQETTWKKYKTEKYWRESEPEARETKMLSGEIQKKTKWKTVWKEDPLFDLWETIIQMCSLNSMHISMQLARAQCQEMSFLNLNGWKADESFESIKRLQLAFSLNYMITTNEGKEMLQPRNINTAALMVKRIPWEQGKPGTSPGICSIDLVQAGIWFQPGTTTTKIPLPQTWF